MRTDFSEITQVRRYVVQRKLSPLVFGILFVRNAHKKDVYT